MEITRAIATLVVLAGLLTHAHGCSIEIINQCPHTVTTCRQQGRGPGQQKGRIMQIDLLAGHRVSLGLGSACTWNNAAIWPSVRGKCESYYVRNMINKSYQRRNPRDPDLGPLLIGDPDVITGSVGQKFVQMHVARPRRFLPTFALVFMSMCFHTVLYDPHNLLFSYFRD
ncbi:hypothetical protein R1sor_012799 [Riccia sorocarpa]|uniref:Secreted protein n=1 Tax=Riccia sorocarpa TaxID=122646 RepID=A0ABD3I560_9MARC